MRISVSHKFADGRRSNSESGCVIGFIGRPYCLAVLGRKEWSNQTPAGKSVYTFNAVYLRECPGITVKNDRSQSQSKVQSQLRNDRPGRYRSRSDLRTHLDFGPGLWTQSYGPTNITLNWPPTDVSPPAISQRSAGQVPKASPPV